MRVLAISCVTNMAAGILDQPINHKEVLETGERVKAKFIQLLEAHHAAGGRSGRFLVFPSGRRPVVIPNPARNLLLLPTR